jgi:hypothetical protein
MIHPYQLHSLGKLYHEEALKEAQRRRHLGLRAKAHRRARLEEQDLRWSISSWVGKLLGAVRLS